MAGIVTSATLLTGTIPREFTYPEYAAFVQDDWRILPRVTVNLGLRYEYTAPLHEASSLVGNVDIGSPAGIIQQGQKDPFTSWIPGPSRRALGWPGM